MRLLIADDHEMVRDTVSAFLAREPDLACDAANDLSGALAAVGKRHYDLVLLDYGMPGMNGLDGLAQAIAAGVGAVAIVSGVAPRAVAREALAAGAAGFLPKTMPARELIAAVRFMLAGGRYVPVEMMNDAPANPLGVRLSERERQVLDGLCDGMANKEIGRAVGLAEVTVKLHVRTLCRKLGARNRTHAVVLARAAGVV